MDTYYNILTILGDDDNSYNCRMFALNITLVLSRVRLSYRNDANLSKESVTKVFIAYPELEVTPIISQEPLIILKSNMNIIKDELTKVITHISTLDHFWSTVLEYDYNAPDWNNDIKNKYTIYYNYNDGVLPMPIPLYGVTVPINSLTDELKDKIRDRVILYNSIIQGIYVTIEHYYYGTFTHITDIKA